MKRRRGGKSKSSTSWPKGVRKGRSWNVDWNGFAGSGKNPVLDEKVVYQMKWKGGKNLKVVQVTVKRVVKEEFEF